MGITAVRLFAVVLFFSVLGWIAICFVVPFSFFQFLVFFFFVFALASAKHDGVRVLSQETSENIIWSLFISNFINKLRTISGERNKLSTDLDN